MEMEITMREVSRNYIPKDMIFFTIRKYSQSTKSILYRIGVILFVIELKWIQNENSLEKYN